MSVRVSPLFLNGRWVRTSEALEVRNPYGGKRIARVAQAGEDEIEAAIRSAQEAFRSFRKWASFERAELLQRIHREIEKEAEAFAQTIRLEAGKPITLARGEVTRTLLTLQTAAEEAKRFGGELLPLDLQPDSRGRTGLYRRFPIGPILAITPFNFPLNLVAHKVGPALACGNTVVLKPASKTPLSALRLAKACEKAGLPKGVLNVIPCSGQAIGQAVEDSRIKKISFTGSAQVGWGLKEVSGKKKITLELGGNAAAIVDRDADLKPAASRIARGAFAYAGQSCISVQRVLIHEKVYKAFLSHLLNASRKEAVLGDPVNPRVLVGPLIETATADRVEEWIKEAKRGGAKVLLGGRRRPGNFIEPTILANVRQNLSISCEEAFGPVALVEPFKDFSEALRRVNDSRFGLQAGVFTNTLDHVLEAYETLEVGGIMINDYPTYRTDSMPYGGTKESGFGREGIRYAIEEMTEPKLLVLRKSRWES